MAQIKTLGPDDVDLLLQVEPGLFDNPVNEDQARAFLADPLHHIVVALEDGSPVSFASGSVLLHPDKPPSLFVNEVGTRDAHQRRGDGHCKCRPRAGAEGRRVGASDALGLALASLGASCFVLRFRSRGAP